MRDRADQVVRDREENWEVVRDLLAVLDDYARRLDEIHAVSRREDDRGLGASRGDGSAEPAGSRSRDSHTRYLAPRRGQLTLGEWIAILRSLPRDRVVIGLGELDSYRGYYEQLAIGANTDAAIPVERLLEDAEKAIGAGFAGWKGDTFFMDETTPMWVSDRGTSSGWALLGLDDDGSLLTPLVELDGDFADDLVAPYQEVW